MKGYRHWAPVVIVVLSLAAFGSEVRAYSFAEITSCPFVIALPGNYAVDGDLTAIGDCILVQTDSVLLNLNGYTITGNGTGSGVSDGGNARQHINVGKGTISHFKTRRRSPLDY